MIRLHKTANLRLVVVAVRAPTNARITRSLPPGLPHLLNAAQFLHVHDGKRGGLILHHGYDPLLFAHVLLENGPSLFVVIVELPITVHRLIIA